MENPYLPILHKVISLRDLRASSEPCLEGRAGGENGFTDADYCYSQL